MGMAQDRRRIQRDLPGHFLEVNNMKPHFTHYCPNCVFTGQSDQMDYYWCPGPHTGAEGVLFNSPRIVVRNGRNPTQTGSVPIIHSANPIMINSLLSAIKAGKVDKLQADDALGGEKLPV